MKKTPHFYNIFVWFTIILDENARLLVVFRTCIEDLSQCEQVSAAPRSAGCGGHLWVVVAYVRITYKQKDTNKNTKRYYSFKNEIVQ